MITILLACARTHLVPVPSGVATAVYALAGPRLKDAVEGTLEGPFPGRCFLGPEGDGHWWVLEVATPSVGTYLCNVTGRRSPPIRVDPGVAEADGRVHGEYRCGIREVPLVPAIPQPDGSYAIVAYEPVPCTIAYPGAGLPFPWGAGP